MSGTAIAGGPKIPPQRTARGDGCEKNCERCGAPVVANQAEVGPRSGAWPAALRSRQPFAGPARSARSPSRPRTQASGSARSAVSASPRIAGIGSAIRRRQRVSDAAKPSPVPPLASGFRSIARRAASTHPARAGIESGPTFRPASPALSGQGGRSGLGGVLPGAPNAPQPGPRAGAARHVYETPGATKPLGTRLLDDLDRAGVGRERPTPAARRLRGRSPCSRRLPSG